MQLKDLNIGQNFKCANGGNDKIWRKEKVINGYHA